MNWGNNLGNFVKRVSDLLHKFYDGVVPEYYGSQTTEFDADAIMNIQSIKTEYENSIDSYRFKDALFKCMEISSLGNKYLQDTEPWKVIKVDINRVAQIMNIAVSFCRCFI